MQTSRGSTLKGVITISLMVVNVVFWVPLLLVVALAKLIIPLAAWRRWTSALMIWIAQAWISCNGAIFSLLGALRLEVEGVAGLDPRSWYLVLSNHRSWVDILVLQQAFNRRIPFLKFFLKQELIWVPFLGLAWWALDFPFMKRHSATYLQKHPEARGEDLDATRKACQRFALLPTSVMNFVEGTRFTPAKHAAQRSPYKHLLKPKAGGMALALNAMGDKFQAILDVTIVYPDGTPTFWHFLQGRLRRVVVRARLLPIPRHLVGANYSGDANVRASYQAWVQQLWREKDALITELLSAPAPRHPTTA